MKVGKGSPRQPLLTVRRVMDLRRLVAGWREAKETVGLIPTMGSLHEGHLALVRRAKAENARAIATIFVNPKQFDRKEDLESYPRDQELDAALLAEADCDLLFAPAVEEVYPAGFVTSVAVAELTACLDGLHRPGHFNGVTTVVAKLLLQSLPDRAYFGEKDYQQLTVVKRMVRDLDIPVRIVPVPTVREADGLAMSSRNQLLTPVERAVAPLLAKVLTETAAALAGGRREAAPLLAEARLRLGRGGFDKVDYVELRAADDLAALERVERPARLLAAAWLGTTRLIDNLPVA